MFGSSIMELLSCKQVPLKEKIAAYAVNELQVYGYESFSYHRLADQLQVGVDEINHLFVSKHSLVTACFNKVLEYCDNKFFTAATTTLLSDDRLPFLIDSILHFMKFDPVALLYSKLLSFQSVNFELDKLLKVYFRRWEEVFSCLSTRFIADSEAELYGRKMAVGNAYWGSLTAYAVLGDTRLLYWFENELKQLLNM